MTALGAARRQPAVAAAILATAGLAWFWTVRRMAGMDAGPGTALGTLGWFTGSWVLMMAAMMLPSFTPAVTAYATLAGGRRPDRLVSFAGGYLLVWAGAGLCAYGLFELGKSLLATELAWPRGGRWLTSGMLILAAAYELIPLKHMCLARCRGQLGDPPDGARDGWATALATGARSGAWCVGCSWALMAALFALGVMSLTWMALIAALVALQKVSPWPRASRIATATVLAALAVGILLAPHRVPGLVVPDSTGTHTMKAMGG